MAIGASQFRMAFPEEYDLLLYDMPIPARTIRQYGEEYMIGPSDTKVFDLAPVKGTIRWQVVQVDNPYMDEYAIRNILTEAWRYKDYDWIKERPRQAQV